MMIETEIAPSSAAACAAGTLGAEGVAETRRIQKLSRSIVNKIAAGEVIERPGSVLKELLENSLDALAMRIEVDAEQGGAELIRVTDDGEGIHPDDAELAIMSHATSKIEVAEDLFSVRTMGFRGEALASIAEISRFRMRTRQADQPVGVELEVEGGIVKEPRPCGCPPGTTVEVRELFITTPVRRKFLKTPTTEFAHLAEQFTRIALANPSRHLILRHNGRTAFDLPATNRLLDRLELFYGGDLTKDLIPLDARVGSARLWGYVAHPRQSKSTRKGQHLYLNGRWFQDRALQHALAEAYRGLLMTGRYPIAFLFFEADPDAADVNVHPTKIEVRFQDPSLFFRLLLSTLRTKFLSLNLESQLNLDRGDRANPQAAEAAEPLEVQPELPYPGIGFQPVDSPIRPDRLAAVPTEREEQVQRELVDWVKQQLAAWQPNTDITDLEARATLNQRNPAVLEEEHPPEPSEWDSASRSTELGPLASDPLLALLRSTPDFRPFPPLANAPVARAVFAATETPAPPVAQSPVSRPVASPDITRAMQVHDCYLIAESAEGLTIVDQHALHERILYEHFRKRILSGGIEVQRLLVPLTVELTMDEAALILDQAATLAELGILIEEFGGRTVALTGLPVMLSRSDPRELIRSIVDHLQTTGRSVTHRDLLDSILALMSCKAAIKSGQRLSPEEIESLLSQRHLVDDAHHCPHGRPTALNFSRHELDRQFGRLGS